MVASAESANRSAARQARTGGRLRTCWLHRGGVYLTGQALIFPFQAFELVVDELIHRQSARLLASDVFVASRGNLGLQAALLDLELRCVCLKPTPVGQPVGCLFG